jgi:hypothetical protein
MSPKGKRGARSALDMVSL